MIEGRFGADCRANLVEGQWYPELIPSYANTEPEIEIDDMLKEMIQHRFDPNHPFPTADECLDYAQAQFKDAVRQYVAANES